MLFRPVIVFGALITHAVAAQDVVLQRERAVVQNSSESSANFEPLVPGFDVTVELPPVPGFGNGSQFSALTITARDRAEAERAIRRYDTNRNHQLEADEIQRGRWTSDPLQADRNGDGILILAEFSLRYARRRMDRESTPSSSPSSSSPGGSGNRRAQVGQEVLNTHERTGVGRLTGQGRRRDSGRTDSSESQSGGSEESAKLKPYRITSPYERDSFPSGVPEWFKDKDANFDGQVLMSEFSSVWTDHSLRDCNSVRQQSKRKK